MKVRLKAGAEIDLLTQEELEKQFREHERRLTGGIEWRHIPYAGSVMPAIIGTPETGYVWSVKLVSVVFNAADKCFVQLSTQNSPLGYDPATDTNHVITWSSDQAVIFAGEVLQVNGSGTAVSASGFVTVKQTPVSGAWRL